MNRLSTATERGLFSGSLALSIGLHAVLAMLVLMLGGIGRQPAPPPVLTVNLVAPPAARPGSGGSSGPAGAPGPKAGAPKQPAAAPAATLAQPAAPPVKPKLRKPRKRAAAPMPRPRPQAQRTMALPRPRPTPPPVVPEPLRPRPAAPPVASRPSVPAPESSSFGAAQSGGARAGRAAAGTGSGSGSGPPSSAVLGYGQRGPGGGGGALAAQRHYLQLIRARILAQRKYPYMARQRRQEGVVRLRFTLSPAGSLSQGVQVVKPSGHSLLDEQARQCVLAAAPFPPFPLDLRRDRLAVELPIIYKISELER